MAFPTRPTDDPEWAEDSAALVSEPENERARGFPFQYIPPAGQINWLQRTIGRWIDYFRRSAGGGFDNLADLIDALEPGECAMLATPDLQPGDELDRIKSASEIHAIAVDGLRVFYASENASGDLELTAYDLVSQTSVSLYTQDDVDLSLPARLVCNGDFLVLAYTRADGNQSLIERFSDFETADQEPDWQRWGIAASGDAAVTGLEITASFVYWTTAGTGNDDRTQALQISNGFPPGGGSNISANGTSVRAANGRYVALTVGSGTVSVRSPDLAEEIWSHTHGATGALSLMAMDGERLYVSTDDDEILVYSVAFSARHGATYARPYGRLIVDTEDLHWYIPDVTTLNASPVKNPDLPGSPWSVLAEDLDFGGAIIDFATDGQAVYIAAETSTVGTYAIWVLAKGQPPKIWRRLDPTDDDAWPRTLAAPM